MAEVEVEADVTAALARLGRARAGEETGLRQARR
jgi:hypothetical protein